MDKFEQLAVDRLVHAEGYAKSYIKLIKSYYDKLQVNIETRLKSFIYDHALEVNSNVKRVPVSAINRYWPDVAESIREDILIMEGDKLSDLDQLFDELILAAFYVSAYDIATIYQYGMVTTDIDVSLSPESIIFEGKTYQGRVADDTEKLSYRIPRYIERGLRTGESVSSIFKTIAKTLNTSYNSNVEQLIQTYTNAMYNEGRQQAYDEFDVSGYVYTAILDSVTTEICRDLDGSIFRVEDITPFVNYPPLHYNCRSTTYPVAGSVTNFNPTFEEFINMIPGISEREYQILQRYY